MSAYAGRMIRSYPYAGKVLDTQAPTYRAFCSIWYQRKVIIAGSHADDVFAKFQSLIMV